MILLPGREIKVIDLLTLRKLVHLAEDRGLFCGTSVYTALKKQINTELSYFSVTLPCMHLIIAVETPLPNVDTKKMITYNRQLVRKSQIRVQCCCASLENLSHTILVRVVYDKTRDKAENRSSRRTGWSALCCRLQQTLWCPVDTRYAANEMSVAKQRNVNDAS